MKKQLCVILLLALLLPAVFAACNNTPNTPAPTDPSTPNTSETPNDPETQTPPPVEDKTLTITLSLPTETKTIVANDAGEYTLVAPTRVGFDFIGWKTADGADFPASGTLTESVAVHAEWRIHETATFAQLKERIEAGADTILLTDSFALTETIYVVANTEITAETDVMLTRSADFLGDLFVIGETPEGKNVIPLSGSTASLSLKPNDATLAIDGNAMPANGTAFLLVNSSTLNIYDGVWIQNHFKIGNDHLTPENDYNVSYPEKVGGAAAIITSGTMNMYGGTITACSVSDGDAESSCGGAIYNYGSFYMYGGLLDNNAASRGGAIYNYRGVKIYAGTITNNVAAAYGGVMYMPNSQYTSCVLGSEGTGFDVTIANNRATKSGGAIFSSHQSAVDILGNTLFDSNSSASNGGAMNVAGSLTIRYAVFTNNTATGNSSKGGAIYAYYGDESYSTRIVSIEGGIFMNNICSRGGAIAFYGNDDVDPPKGAIGYVGNVSFLYNTAPKNGSDKYGYGGAICAGLASTVTVSKEASFYGNTADGNGADFYETSDGKIIVEGTEATPANLGN